MGLAFHSPEEAYVHWIKHYILFHHRRHPAEMGATEITEFYRHVLNRGGRGVVSPADRL